MLDEKEILARLERADIPNVDQFHVTVRLDSTGEVAAFIYVIVPDEITREPDFFERTRAIDATIFQLFKREFAGYWPYVRFRSVSEMASL